MINTYFKAFPYLSDLEIAEFIELTRDIRLKKGDYFVREGQVSLYVAFIKSGILRSFYYSSDAESVTYCFTPENNLITAYSSWIKQAPSFENIEALTDVELSIISKSSIELLFEKYPNWLRFFKDLAENEFIGLEKRIFLLQRESAETRYQDLLDNSPSYIDQIPLQYLASYLGVTERHLRRIRKKA